jgi:hypothetical protein
MSWKIWEEKPAGAGVYRVEKENIPAKRAARTFGWGIPSSFFQNVGRWNNDMAVMFSK